MEKKEERRSEKERGQDRRIDKRRKK